MRLTVDLDTLQLIASASDRRRQTLVEFKRGDLTPIELQFVRNGVPEALETGVVITFALKESGKYDGDFVVFFDEFSAPSASPNFIYSGTPSLSTEELDDLLFVDGNQSNDLASVDLMGEITWEDDANPASIRTFVARVHNDVVRGTEGTPLALPTPLGWLAANGILYAPAIVDFVGGDPTDLDSLPTANLPLNTLLLVSLPANQNYLYRLSEGDNETNSPEVIRPADYEPETNERVWFIESEYRGAFSVVGLNIRGSLPNTGATLITPNLTDVREINLPDADGTLALISDVVTESTTARSLTIDDVYRYIRLTNASPCAITVPANADVAFPINTEIYFRIAAAGIPTITEGSGVTVNNKASVASMATHATFAIKKVATNTWDLI
jgi:hypothetical protein